MSLRSVAGVLVVAMERGGGDEAEHADSDTAPVRLYGLYFHICLVQESSSLVNWFVIATDNNSILIYICQCWRQEIENTFRSIIRQ